MHEEKLLQIELNKMRRRSGAVMFVSAATVAVGTTSTITTDLLETKKRRINRSEKEGANDGVREELRRKRLYGCNKGSETTQLQRFVSVVASAAGDNCGGDRGGGRGACAGRRSIGSSVLLFPS